MSKMADDEDTWQLLARAVGAFETNLQSSLLQYNSRIRRLRDLQSRLTEAVQELHLEQRGFESLKIKQQTEIHEMEDRLAKTQMECESKIRSADNETKRHGERIKKMTLENERARMRFLARKEEESVVEAKLALLQPKVDNQTLVSAKMKDLEARLARTLHGLCSEHEISVNMVKQLQAEIAKAENANRQLLSKFEGLQLHYERLKKSIEKLSLENHLMLQKNQKVPFTVTDTVRRDDASSVKDIFQEEYQRLFKRVECLKGQLVESYDTIDSLTSRIRLLNSSAKTGSKGP